MTAIYHVHLYVPKIRKRGIQNFWISIHSVSNKSQQNLFFSKYINAKLYNEDMTTKVCFIFLKKALLLK